MQLSTFEQDLISKTIKLVAELNVALDAMRSAGIACNIKEDSLSEFGRSQSRWMLDMKMIIRREHFA